MYSESEIKIKSWLVRSIVDLVLADSGLSVDKIFLVGSYAQGKATEYSDIDFLVQLKGGKRPLTYPTWRQMGEINDRLDNKRLHVIYGTFEAQESLWRKNAVKYTFKEIKNVDKNTSSNAS